MVKRKFDQFWWHSRPSCTLEPFIVDVIQDSDYDEPDEYLKKALSRNPLPNDILS